jgi:hypothetical protein
VYLFANSEVRTSLGIHTNHMDLVCLDTDDTECSGSYDTSVSCLGSIITHIYDFLFGGLGEE